VTPEYWLLACYSINAKGVKAYIRALLGGVKL